MTVGAHFGHDGLRYHTLALRNKADNTFDQTNAGRRGKGNSHTVRGATAPWHKDGAEYIDQEWAE